MQTCVPTVAATNIIVQNVKNNCHTELRQLTINNTIINGQGHLTQITTKISVSEVFNIVSDSL